MLKTTNSKKFKYYEKGRLQITAIGPTEITIGTPKTRIKEAKDGFNHPDLAAGALANFFCWPPQHVLLLNPQETYSIEPFVAFQIRGNHQIEGQYYGEHKFSVS